MIQLDILLYLESGQVWDNKGADLLPLDKVSSTLSVATRSTTSGTYNGVVAG